MARNSKAPPLPGNRPTLELIAERIQCLPDILTIVNKTLVELHEIKVADKTRFDHLEHELGALKIAVSELRKNDAADIARFKALEDRMCVLEGELRELRSQLELIRD